MAPETPDGTKLTTISVDHDVIESIGTKTAILDTPLTLSASTDYFIVFEYRGSDGHSDSVSLSAWTSGDTQFNEDPSATGWSIDDAYYSQSAGLSWSRNVQGHVTIIELNGSLVPTQTVDLHANSDTGFSQTDNITRDNTPDITVAGFDATDNVTVTAVKVGTSTTVSTPTGTGNGTYTLPDLSRWALAYYRTQCTGGYHTTHSSYYRF